MYLTCLSKGEGGGERAEIKVLILYPVEPILL